MSSSNLTPGAKAENAVYLAFGVTASLYLIKQFRADLFAIAYTRELIAATFFGASVIGAVLFYVKFDRIIPWLLKKIIVWRKGEWMSVRLASIRIFYRTFHIAMLENWPTIEEECEISIISVLESSDMYDEVWKLKGGVYFILGIILLGFGINPESAIILWSFSIIDVLSIEITLQGLLIVIIPILVFASMLYSARVLLTRVPSISLMHLFNDTRSVSMTRMQLGQNNAPILDEYKPTIPDRTVDSHIMEELGNMIIAHDWSRFCRRLKDFTDSIETYIMNLTTTQAFDSTSLNYCLESAVRSFSTDSKKESKHLQNQATTIDNWRQSKGLASVSRLFEISDFLSLCRFVQSSTGDTWRRHLQNHLSQSFLNERFKKSSYDTFQGNSISEIFLRWCKESINKACRAVLVLITDITSKQVAEESFNTLDIDGRQNLWSYITVKNLERMAEVGSNPSKEFIAAIISNESPQREEEIQKSLEFCILKYHFTYGGWLIAIQKSQNLQINLTSLNSILHKKKAKENFIELVRKLNQESNDEVKKRSVALVLSLKLIDKKRNEKWAGQLINELQISTENKL
jgi:hypothetical protein